MVQFEGRQCYYGWEIDDLIAGTKEYKNSIRLKNISSIHAIFRDTIILASNELGLAKEEGGMYK